MVISIKIRWSIGVGLLMLAAVSYFVSASARYGRASAEIRGGTLTLSWTVYEDWPTYKGWTPPPLVQNRIEWSPSIGESLPILRETTFFTFDGGFHGWAAVIPLWLPALVTLLWPALSAMLTAVRRRLTAHERFRQIAATTARIAILLGMAFWGVSAFIWIDAPTRFGNVSVYGGAVSLDDRRSLYFTVDSQDRVGQPRLPLDRLIPHVKSCPWPDEWGIPTWLPAAVSGGILILLRRPVRIGHCRQCAYDLTGNVSGRCPECGTATTAEELQQGPREFANSRQSLHRRRGDADPA